MPGAYALALDHLHATAERGCCGVSCSTGQCAPFASWTTVDFRGGVTGWAWRGVCAAQWAGPSEAAEGAELEPHRGRGAGALALGTLSTLLTCLGLMYQAPPLPSCRLLRD